MQSHNLLKTAFDIDGVFCHTWKLMIELFNEKGFPVTEDDMTCFKLEKCLKLSEKVIREVITESLAVENMSRKEINQMAVWCAKSLYQATGKTIPFITSRKEPKNTIYYMHEYVVKNQFPFIVLHGDWGEKRTPGERKLEQIKQLGCIAMVEDAPETLAVLSTNGIIPLLIDRPYNQYCTWALRFKEWRGVFNLALALEGIYASTN